MFEELHFLRESVVDINAAVVGVSKNKWKSIEEDIATAERAAEIMRRERFDVLPIASGSVTKEFFQTDRWNDYSMISRKSITHRDVISLQTYIRDVIRDFASEPRCFYFLSHESRIVGLVSIVNLNCRQVKVYLFSLLSELETRLGRFISEHTSETELLEMAFEGDDKNKYEEIKNRYKKDRSSGVDVAFVEYLYLSDVVNITLKTGLYSELGYGKNKFKANFGSLVDLRNTVAHPNRSVTTSTDSVVQLWQRIDRIEDALFRLRICQEP